MLRIALARTFRAIRAYGRTVRVKPTDLRVDRMIPLVISGYAKFLTLCLAS